MNNNDPCAAQELPGLYCLTFGCNPTQRYSLLRQYVDEVVAVDNKGMGASNVTSVHPAVHKTSSAEAGNRIREGVMDGRNEGVGVREGKVSLFVPT